MVGSGYFTDNATVPRDSIVAQINVDMIGRGGAADVTGGGPGYVQLIGSRRLSTELGNIVEAEFSKSRGLSMELPATQTSRAFCICKLPSLSKYSTPVTLPASSCRIRAAWALSRTSRLPDDDAIESTPALELVHASVADVPIGASTSSNTTQTASFGSLATSVMVSVIRVTLTGGPSRPCALASDLPGCGC